jgi:hypothetical protein
MSCFTIKTNAVVFLNWTWHLYVQVIFGTSSFLRLLVAFLTPQLRNYFNDPKQIKRGCRISLSKGFFK